MKQKIVRIEIFGGELHILHAEDLNKTLEYVNEKYGSDYDESKESDKALSLTFEGKDKKHYFFILIKDVCLSHVVHESIHMSWMILKEHYGCDINCENDELQCYFVDYLVKNIMDSNGWEEVKD